MSSTKKISASLAAQLVADLDFISSRTGVSRSALISEFLGEAVAETRKVFELIPPNPTPADVLRMRGESEQLIRQRLSSLQGITDDLFSK